MRELLHDLKLKSTEEWQHFIKSVLAAGDKDGDGEPRPQPYPALLQDTSYYKSLLFGCPN